MIRLKNLIKLLMLNRLHINDVIMPIQNSFLVLLKDEQFHFII